ncbi:MAG: hypothetical protein UY41_C0015G0019 [Candidatus Moranbacteria bacterium GW2011_GWE1_49_15]|nr:MAG: hypothetical protein UY41_C0015G0019 [Candidatus Moranbacteria bacterium GW2011_GWE1_49_15]
MVNNEPEPQVQIKNEANGGSQITVEEILEIQKKAVEETQQNESVDSSENVPSIEEIMEQQKKASSEAVSSEPEYLRCRGRLWEIRNNFVLLIHFNFTRNETSQKIFLLGGSERSGNRVGNLSPIYPRLGGTDGRPSGR